MKFLILFVALFAVALAAPAATGPEVEILRQESDVGPEGYKYGWETSDGTKANEEGLVKNAGSEDEAISVHGSYTYTAPDGQVISVTYVADENGFQPEGAHLPVAPENPHK